MCTWPFCNCNTNVGLFHCRFYNFQYLLNASDLGKLHTESVKHVYCKQKWKLDHTVNCQLFHPFLHHNLALYCLKIKTEIRCRFFSQFWNVSIVWQPGQFFAGNSKDLTCKVNTACTAEPHAWFGLLHGSDVSYFTDFGIKRMWMELFSYQSEQTNNKVS